MISLVNNTAEAAYSYLYPLVLMDETKKQQCRATNTWMHSRSYPPGHFKVVIRPNFDTLYSIAWLDLSSGPVVIQVPDTNGRYYCMHMMDMWTDSFAVPGSRTWGTSSNSCVVLGPDDHQQASHYQNDDDGDPHHHVFRAPTSSVWIINRIQTNGEDDYPAVHALQDSFHITNLDGTPPPSSSVGRKQNISKKMSPSSIVKRMSAKDFFNTAVRLLASSPPHQADGSIVLQLERLGMHACSYDTFDFAGLSPSIQRALEVGAVAGWSGMRNFPLVDKIVHGWEMMNDGIGVYGNSYVRRACVAASGLGAVPPEDAVYSTLSKSLPSDGRYEIVFKSNDLPPCDAFWSMTLYVMNY